MRIIIGCDGGGTKTVAIARLVHEDGSTECEGRGATGPSNVLANDVQVALNNLVSAIRLALHNAGIADDTHPDTMVLALAGAGRPEQQTFIERHLAGEFRAHHLAIIPDYLAVLEAARLESLAVVLIAGTGSVAWARDRTGCTFRAGGWGPLLGDEGSAHWIGLQAIKETVKRLNCHNSSSIPLVRCVLRHFEVGDLPNLIQSVYSAETDRSRIAGLAERVFELTNDDTASRIVTQAASHLAELVIDVTGRLDTPDPIAWACAGGVLLYQPLLREQVRQHCHKVGLILPEPALVDEPVHGALRMALSLHE